MAVIYGCYKRGFIAYNGVINYLGWITINLAANGEGSLANFYFANGNANHREWHDLVE